MTDFSNDLMNLRNLRLKLNGIRYKLQLTVGYHDDILHVERHNSLFVLDMAYIDQIKSQCDKLTALELATDELYGEASVALENLRAQSLTFTSPESLGTSSAIGILFVDLQAEVGGLVTEIMNRALARQLFLKNLGK